MLKLEELALLINDHIEGEKLYKSEFFLIEKIIQEYPFLKESIYEGPAYRIIYARDINDISFNPNHNISWTKKDGLRFEKFLSSYKPFDQDGESPFILDADIFGVDINKLIDILENHKIFINRKFMDEEEILALEVRNTDIIDPNEQFS